MQVQAYAAKAAKEALQAFAFDLGEITTGGCHSIQSFPATRSWAR